MKYAVTSNVQRWLITQKEAFEIPMKNVTLLREKEDVPKRCSVDIAR